MWKEPSQSKHPAHTVRVRAWQLGHYLDGVVCMCVHGPAYMRQFRNVGYCNSTQTHERLLVTLTTCAKDSICFDGIEWMESTNIRPVTGMRAGLYLLLYLLLDSRKLNFFS